MPVKRLPPRAKLYAALLSGEPCHEGRFVAAARKRREFCRPSCTRIKPDIDDVVFFRTGTAAESRGFRPCSKCLPERPNGSIRLSPLRTPLGPMLAGATDQGLCLLEFENRRRLEVQIHLVSKRLRATPVPGDHAWLDQTQVELDEYFSGNRQVFEVPLHRPGTPFQTSVWQVLSAMRYGSRRSYESVAREIGRPKAFRAVGKANGDNPLAILVPCHRLVRSDGSLCDYGGGLWRKQALLDLEQQNA